MLKIFKLVKVYVRTLSHIHTIKIKISIWRSHFHFLSCIEHQLSISSTFFGRVFCTKVLFSSYVFGNKKHFRTKNAREKHWWNCLQNCYWSLKIAVFAVFESANSQNQECNSKTANREERLYYSWLSQPSIGKVGYSLGPLLFRGS